jgi:hypothetical protein
VRNIAVVDFRSIKSGALYYDYVLPAFPKVEITNEVTRDYDRILTEKVPGGSDAVRKAAVDMILKHGKSGLNYEQSLEFVHPKMRDNSSLMAFFLWTYVMAIVAWGSHTDPENHPRAKTWSDGIDMARSSINQLSLEMNLKKFPLFRSAYVDEFETAEDELKEDVVAELGNIKLIDADLLTFEHIAAIRKDALARKQLQSLRTFLRTDFKGKSFGELEDALGRSMLDYELAAKKHGAILANATISGLIGSPATLHALGAALGLTLIANGQEEWGVGILAVQLAGATFGVAKSLAERREGLVKHEMAYFSTVKQTVRMMPELA